MSEEISAKEGAEEHFQRAGETLAAARIKKKMTLEQVSDHLKISIRYLQAMEACHYDQLPGTAFARGYLRSYARLMDIDEHQILDLFGETVQADEQVARLLKEKPLDQHGVPGGRWLAAVALVLVVGFVSGSVLWWRTETVEPPVGVPPAMSVESPSGGSFSPGSQNDSDEVIGGEPVADSGGLETYDVSVADDGVESAVLVSTSDQLYIQFSGDCWVEVLDIDGDVLFSGIKTDQNELRLTGRGPLTVKFGNVEAVASIQFNGKPVELNSSVSGRNIGRLTLG